MKKLLIVAAALSIAFSAGASQTPATDNPLSSLGSLLGGNKTNSSDNSNSGSGLGDMLGGLVNGLLGTDKITADRLVGTWNYTGPAVCFKTQDLLKKAGGSAIATTLESKLAPYYTQFGLDKMQLVVEKDQSFVMTSGKITLKGTITIEEQDVYFNFAAFGKIPMGKMKTYINMGVTSKEMSLMFDVSKLMTILKAVGGATNMKSLTTITALLDNYDGLAVGFKLKK